MCLQGEVKKPESFWSTMKSIWRIIRTRYGNVRLDFGQPFSLQVCYLFLKFLVFFYAFMNLNEHTSLLLNTEIFEIRKSDPKFER